MWMFWKFCNNCCVTRPLDDSCLGITGSGLGGGSHRAYCPSRNASSRSPLPHWDTNESKFHREISTAAGKSPGPQVTREVKGRNSRRAFLCVRLGQVHLKGGATLLFYTFSQTLLGAMATEAWKVGTGSARVGSGVQTVHREDRRHRRPGMLPDFRMAAPGERQTLPLPPSPRLFVTPRISPLFSVRLLRFYFLS